ncbi:hypothetical protein FRC02_000483 [Tulasnella sp. 418]|nr:hypothetical protein FRC02_000483 [Tulasnella sp. 418]
MSRTVPFRTPYRGESKLVISIDFGTTFSGTSWVLLEDGQVPHIWDVTGFEGQEHIQVPKVPTVLYYDNQGQMRAAGGQTLGKGIITPAAREQWTRVEWFKLLLRPDYLAATLDRAPKPQMPRNKGLIDIIADFLRYMASLAEKHFHEAMDADGRIWNEMRNKKAITYILSYSNGWNTSEHSIMRDAAIMAGLVPNTNQGRDRIMFVSEGEASLHWCMSKGIGRGDLKVGSHFIVVDAGGGTIDISSFKTISTVPLEFEESCHLQCSAFVTKAFENYVKDKLKGSSFGDPDTIDRLVQDFDLQVKRNFRNDADDLHVRFGKHQDNDPNFGIKDGELLVRGTRMTEFFEPACHTIDASVKGIIGGGKAIVVFVGGFAGNSYLFEEVKRRLAGPNIEVIRTNDATAKAAANGIICFYLDRSVKARMAKWTYGVPCVHDFDPKYPKHIQRKSRVQTNPATGKQFIEGGFFVTLKKDTVVHETELARFPFWHNQPTQTAATLEIVLQCYRGDVPDIKFMDEDHAGERGQHRNSTTPHMEPSDQFQELCWFKAVIAETSLARRKAKVKNKASEKYYYVTNFNIVVSFGATEFKCFIEWKDDKGKTRTEPIIPIWNDSPDPSQRPRITSPDGVSPTNLIISFDLGTTFSAASWVLLGDSQDPHVWDVSEFREDLPAKVPTVLYYDSTGKLRAVGGETLDKRNIADALEQGWTRVESFKLLLHLAHEELNNAPKTNLPRNKKPIDVIADFLRYMARLTFKHFHEMMDTEGKTWKEVKDGVIYIFSHPNGWNTFQYSVLREAAILANLVPDFEEGNNRIIFVSEAEAGLHWCVKRKLGIRDLKVDSSYIVVDAGGGAINISSFRTVDAAPPRFEESSIPECHLQGSVFVTQAFRNFVQDKLKGSSFGNPDAVEQMVRDFDHELKYGFRDRQQDMFVMFGKSQDNDPGLGIKGGQLHVPGEEIAKLFEPACNTIVNSVKANAAPTAQKVVVLVGGFTGNQYLFKEVQRRLQGIVVTRPNDTVSVIWLFVTDRFY